MYLGNLSLGIDGSAFRLLPVQDMCSMGFAPESNGEVMLFTYELPDVKATDFDEKQLSRALLAVRNFWNRVEKDDRISIEFKQFITADDEPSGYIRPVSE